MNIGFCIALLLLLSSCAGNGHQARPGYSPDPTPEKGKNDKYGYVNRSGRFVIKPRFDGAYIFREGKAAVKLNGKWGFIDDSGTIVIEPQFDSQGEFSEGLAAVQIGDKVGAIDTSGKVVIKPQFDYRFVFSEGLAGVRIDDKYGYIDKSGEVIIKLQFDHGYAFVDGIAKIKMNETFGQIYKSGEFYVKPDDVGVYSQGLAKAKTADNKWGYLNDWGNFAIEPKFDHATTFSDGFAFVEQGGGRGVIDLRGNFLIRPQQQPSSPPAEYPPRFNVVIGTKPTHPPLGKMQANPYAFRYIKVGTQMVVGNLGIEKSEASTLRSTTYSPAAGGGQWATTGTRTEYFTRNYRILTSIDLAKESVITARMYNDKGELELFEGNAKSVVEFVLRDIAVQIRLGQTFTDEDAPAIMERLKQLR